MTTADWNADNARRWAALADRLEAQLEPVGELLMAEASIRAGEVVLDVGCGRGTTTRDAAVAAGPDGAVTGIDVAEELVAQARSFPAGGAPIEWVVADAQRHELPPSRYDVVISRFGVMFFDDAVDALANLRRATEPGGRLCVVVWQRRERSELMDLPVRIAQRVAARHDVELDPGPPDRGPFGWSDREEVLAVLRAAGWVEARHEPREVPLHLGGPGPVEQAVQTTMSIGAVQRALAVAPEEVVDAVRAALVDELGPRHDGTGVELGAGLVVVHARNPGA